MLFSNHVTTDPNELIKSLEWLRMEVLREGQALINAWQPRIERQRFSPGAENLAYYLALRRRDLRNLQISLMPWGLSSLGHIESRVLAGLDAVIATLNSSINGTKRAIPHHEMYFSGNHHLHEEAAAVLGAEPPHRHVRIMVTFPPEAAEDYDLVCKLLTHGMNCARINCAHDDATAWSKMIEHIRRAEAQTGQTCKILMDLGGPKIRVMETSFGKKHDFFVGDRLLLVYGIPERTPEYPYQISCNLPDILKQVNVGESVWLDDGKVGMRVESLRPEGIVLRITHARPQGRNIRVEKGINFPDTHLHIQPLTDKDLQDLDFVVQYADMIGYSFVQDALDVRMLQSELDKRISDVDRRREIAIIAKIETRTAVRNLPDIIVQAAGQNRFGVMIARGDLAVELGYERLAEMQEEILWLCEAAHVPVIWATQVLEGLVKEGIPSRAEVTDAAMSERAECVMLNKGQFILNGVTVLDNVLVRMSAHQFKRVPGLRALRSWQN
jgi:pyruvate kinase